jgi:hypothetical protein
MHKTSHGHLTISDILSTITKKTISDINSTIVCELKTHDRSGNLGWDDFRRDSSSNTNTGHHYHSMRLGKGGSFSMKTSNCFSSTSFYCTAVLIDDLSRHCLVV